MRTSTARLSLAVAGLAVVGLVGGAQAASKPTVLVVTDETADSLGAPSDDIAKMTYSTTGKTTKKGKSKVYTPTALTMVMELTEDVVTDGSVLYEFAGNAAGCGDFYFDVVPGTAAEGDVSYTSCLDDDTIDFAGSTFAVAGKTLTVTIPLGSVPGMKADSSLTALIGYTGSIDPVTGSVGPMGFGLTPLANDSAGDADTTYKIG